MVLCIAAKTSDIKIVGKLLIKDENFGTGVVSFVYHPGYSSGEVLPKKWVGVCGPLPKTLNLFMSSLQANSRPKSAIFPPYLWAINDLT